MQYATIFKDNSNISSEVHNVGYYTIIDETEFFVLKKGKEHVRSAILQMKTNVKIDQNAYILRYKVKI